MPEYEVEPIFRPSSWLIEADSPEDAERQCRRELGISADDFDFNVSEASR